MMTVTSMQLLKILLIILNYQIKVKLDGFYLRIQGKPQTVLKVCCTIKTKRILCSSENSA